MTHYHTIEKPSSTEYKDRGSRFLAFTFPITSTDDFKKELRTIKEAHQKAAHHCFAYRLGTDGTAYRSSDDGEPAGTAGKPILGQIDSRKLTNVAIIVVRYFGGTLLGVPGLINAYKTSASLALQLTPMVEKPIMAVYHLQFDYTLMNEVMTVVKRYHCEVMQNEMQLFCRMVIGVPKAEEAVFTDRVTDLRGVEVQKKK